MAKKKMKCVFSPQQCKNCSPYIARHYYLCYYGASRLKHRNRNIPVGSKNNASFKIPDLKKEVFDPFKTTL
jgi:hypothetical protein